MNPDSAGDSKTGVALGNDHDFRELLERIPAIYYSVPLGRSDGREPYVSPRIQTELGLPIAEWLAVDGDWGSVLHAEDRERVIQNMRAGMQGGGYSCEYRMLRPDGSELWIRDEATVIHDASGAPRELRGVARNVNESQELMAELSQARQYDAIRVLVGGIAHDFNNLLVGLFVHLDEALRAARPGTQQHADLQSASTGVTRAQALVGQLGRLSRGSAPDLQTRNISGLIRETTTFNLRGTTIDGRVEIAPELWPVEVDLVQIVQVVSNLVLNAVQALPDDGTLTVTATNRSATGADDIPAGDYVHLTVEDNGRGIPDELLPQIFDPYFTTRAEGSGLGLATTRWVVERHRGFLRVDSALGRGTRFEVWLPAARFTEPAAQTTRAIRDSPAVAREPNRLRHALILDDQPTVLETVPIMLRRLGWQTVTAGSGHEAVDRYRDAFVRGAPFATVILDSSIPGGFGGARVLQALRRIDPNVRAILSSGYADLPMIRDHKRYGFAAQLVKPYGPEELQRALDEALAD